MVSRLVRLADACWMTVSGGLLSLVLGAFCLVFDVLAAVGRLGAACLARLAGPAAQPGSARLVRTFAVSVGVVVAVLTLIDATAKFLEGYGTRGQPAPQAVEQDRPEPRRASGRVVARATIDRTGDPINEIGAPPGAR